MSSLTIPLLSSSSLDSLQEKPKIFKTPDPKFQNVPVKKAISRVLSPLQQNRSLSISVKDSLSAPHLTQTRSLGKGESTDTN